MPPTVRYIIIIIIIIIIIMAGVLPVSGGLSLLHVVPANAPLLPARPVRRHRGMRVLHQVEIILVKYFSKNILQWPRVP